MKIKYSPYGLRRITNRDWKKKNNWKLVWSHEKWKIYTYGLEISYFDTLIVFDDSYSCWKHSNIKLPKFVQEALKKIH